MWTTLQARSRNWLRAWLVRRPPSALTRLLPFWLAEQESALARIAGQVRQYTDVSADVVTALCHAAAHGEREATPGGIFLAETRGSGCGLAVAETLLAIGETRRPIVLWEASNDSANRSLLMHTRYPVEKFTLVPPDFHDAFTNDANAPTFSLAFLGGDDGDQVEELLRAIWPRLVPGGILVVEAMGLFGDVSRRVEDFFATSNPGWLAVDHASRCTIKR